MVSRSITRTATKIELWRVHCTHINEKFVKLKHNKNTRLTCSDWNISCQQMDNHHKYKFGVEEFHLLLNKYLKTQEKDG